MSWTQTMAYVFLGYWVFVTMFYLSLLVAAIPEIRTQYRLQLRQQRHGLLSSDEAPSIAAILPSFNEEVTIVASVRAALALNYPDLEVVVVNDGSTDGTLARLVEAYDMVDCGVVHAPRLSRAELRGVYHSRVDPRLVVIDKMNGGKADSLNAGLDWIDSDLFLAVDSDTLVDEEALQRMVRPFLADPNLVVVGGIVKVVNGCVVKDGRVLSERTPARPLWGLQLMEYMRDFMLGRLGLNRMGGNLIVSGAFGLFRREVVNDMGGYKVDCVGEDMELVTRIVREHRREDDRPPIAFLYDAISWTEVPGDLRTLRRQRERWHIGLLQIIGIHHGLLFSRRDRGAGLLVFPSYVFIGALSPIMEAWALLTGILALVTQSAANWLLTWSVLFLAVAIGSTMNLVAVVLDEALFPRTRRVRDRALLLVWAFVEPFGYRQLTSIYRWRGMWRFVRGSTEWGAMKRQGTTTT